MPLLRSLAVKAGMIRTSIDRENKLEREGRWLEAQKLRFKQFERCAPEYEHLLHIHNLIRADQRVLFQVLARAALRTEDDSSPMEHQLRLPSSSSSPATPTKVASLESELLQKSTEREWRSSNDNTPRQVPNQCLDGSREAIWVAEHYRYDMLSKLPDGPVKRAYLSLHKQPSWHLSDWQRSECAARGGCCARKCGCCTRSRYGHPFRVTGLQSDLT